MYTACSLNISRLYCNKRKVLVEVNKVRVFELLSCWCTVCGVVFRNSRPT